MPGIVLSFFIFLTSIYLSESHQTSGVTFELPDNERMCFYEDFEGSKKYILDYAVLKGGNKDVDVKIESPNGKLVYHGVRKSKDNVQFDISWGTYTFCFSNEFSSITHKIVYFELRPEDHSLLAVEGGKNAPTANTQLEESMETVHSYSTQVMEYQKNYRLNEVKGRHEAEELNQRVQSWSLVQSLIILITGLGEIFILKRFFTDRKDPLLVQPLAGLTSQPEVVHAPPLMRP